MRRKCRRYTFTNRRLLDYQGRLPLLPGQYNFIYEQWEVWGPPKIGETATEYLKYVRASGTILKQYPKVVVIESD